MLRLAFLFLAFVDASLLFGTSMNWVVPSTGISPKGALPAAENLAIVVNRSNPVDNLSTPELRRIFLGERGHWPNGRRITIVMIEPGQPERDVVLRDIFRMTETEFSNHFLHGVFTGEVLVSPKTLATPVGVRKFVFNVPGAIGYLRSADVDASVKVVRIDERYPDDKAYPFHVPPQPAN